MPAMTGPRIAIMQACPGRRPSGGNVFNRVIRARARRSGWPVQRLIFDAPQWRGRRWDLIVWDSLLIGRVDRAARERIGLLLHYLPSTEPDLAVAQARRLRAMEAQAMAAADFCIATGPALAAAAAERWPEKRVFLCEPGVSAVFRRRTLRATDGPPVLLTVANLLPGKGFEGALALLARLAARPWRWHIVGRRDADPAFVARLERLAQTAGLRARIVFHGELTQARVAARMAQADVLLHPSLFESYGMVLAEAAAVGLPAVAFRVGAAERLVRHGATGLLAGAADWDTLGRHLVALLEQPGLRARFECNLALSPVRDWDRALADFRAACGHALD